jgi:ClpP class serine protease
MRTTMNDIQRYTVSVLARRDLGPAFTPLSGEDYEKLEQEITRKNREFEAILKDAKA